MVNSRLVDADAMDALYQGTQVAFCVNSAAHDLLYASPAFRERYQQIMGRELPEGKCHDVFHNRGIHCEDCPIHLVNDQHRDPRELRTRRRPFCGGAVDNHSQFFVEGQVKAVGGRAVAVVEFLHHAEHHDYDRLYDIAIRMNQAKGPDDLISVVLENFVELGFPGARSYDVDMNGKLNGLHQVVSVDGRIIHSEYHTQIAKDDSPISFSCFGEFPMPTFVVINEEKSLRTEKSRDLRDIGLRIRYIAEDPLSSLFGKRYGWLDLPIVGPDNRPFMKITCDVVPGTFLYRDDLHKLSVFGSLFYYTYQNTISKKREHMKAVVMGAHEVGIPLQTMMNSVDVIDLLYSSGTKYGKDVEMVFHDIRSTIENMAFANQASKKLFSSDSQWKIDEIDDFYGDVFLPTVKMFGRQARSKRLHIAWESCRNELREMPSLFMDRILLQEVFYNLLGNAIKYADMGTEIGFSLLIHDGWTFLISNTGATVDSDDAGRIFDEGYRGKEAEKYDQTGLGNGLYYARKIAVEMGGWIRMVKGDGPVIFAFYIPSYISSKKWRN